jgi:hypothetical protein
MLNQSLSQATPKLQVYCAFLSLIQSLENFKTHDIHVGHCHILQEKNNPMPPLVCVDLSYIIPS